MLLQLQLTNSQFVRFLKSRKQQTLGLSGGLGSYQEDFLPGALQKISDTIHEQLSSLSPQYYGKPQGYRLPLPRIKRSASNVKSRSTSERGETIGLLEAISSHRTIYVTIPKGYPDNCLPWILASELRLVEIDGRQAVPIVIAGDNIKPPHGNLAVHCEIELAKLSLNESARPIIILTDFQAGSRSRVQFLAQEIENYNSARFIVLKSWGA